MHGGKNSATMPGYYRLMGICICGISALEFYRAYGHRACDLLAHARTSKLDRISIAGMNRGEERLSEMGVLKRPIHVLVDREARRKPNERFICKTHSNLPPRSVIKVCEEVSVVCPELLFLELASSIEKTPREDLLKGEVALALVGFELCGTYLLSNEGQCGSVQEKMRKGFANTHQSLTNKERIEKYIANCGRLDGVASARRALEIIQEGSHSPMESSLFMLLCGPRSHGGMGFPRGLLNYRVKTSRGQRLIDLAWPHFGVGIEYLGRNYHGISEVERDDRRRNEIGGEGVTIFNVRYEDLAQPYRFKQLVEVLSKSTGVRVRVRSSAFWRRHALMKSVVLSNGI